MSNAVFNTFISNILLLPELSLKAGKSSFYERLENESLEHYVELFIEILTAKTIFPELNQVESDNIKTKKKIIKWHQNNAAEALLLYYINVGNIVHLVKFCRLIFSHFSAKSNDYPKIRPEIVTKISKIFKFSVEVSNSNLYCSKWLCSQILEKIASMGQEVLKTNSDNQKNYLDPTVSELVLAWGSNSSNQLSDMTSEKITTPNLIPRFGNTCKFIEAGQYCTFFINKENKVFSVGKGIYGRLGTGESSNHKFPQYIHFKYKDKSFEITQIASSKHGDGHSLALSTCGKVFSWGDGDNGKLGHNSVHAEKKPTLIEALNGPEIIDISVGKAHSACVSKDGRVWTWGDSDSDRLGHPVRKATPTDSRHSRVPELVDGVSEAIQVCCGANHTLILDKRENSVIYSCGMMTEGRLGFGNKTDTDIRHKLNNKLFKVKMAPFKNERILKLQAGLSSSFALTYSGKVFSWGSGAALGHGPGYNDPVLVPKLITALQEERVIDLSVGDNHCIALCENNRIYTWGANSMQQCGFNSSSDPPQITSNVVVQPTLIESISNMKNLLEASSSNQAIPDNVNIQQISAGTTHSFAYTCPPAKTRPLPQKVNYCLDISTECFSELKHLLEASKDINIKVLSNSVKILCNHLFLTKDLINNIAIPNSELALRDIIFDVLESPMLNEECREMLTQAVEDSAWFLFPPLKERLHIISNAILKLTTELEKSDYDSPIPRGSLSRCRCAVKVTLKHIHVDKSTPTHS